MTRVSWCLTTSVDGEIKTIFPGAIEPADLAAIEPIVSRAVERRLKIEAASRTGEHAPAPVPRKPSPPAAEATMTQAEMSRVQGYTGECCDQCFQFKMKQAGHCMVCENCGTTTGCS